MRCCPRSGCRRNGPRGAHNIDETTDASYPAIFFDDPGGTRLELKPR